MKLLQILIITLSINFVYSQEGNYFKNSLIDLSEDILKDSIKVAKMFKEKEVLVKEYEKKHDLSFKKIRTWVSMNYFDDISSIEDDFFYKYYPNIDSNIFDSNESFIAYHINPVSKSNESLFLFMGTEEDTDEPYNAILEKYKQLYLDLKKIEFQHSVMVVLSIFSEKYNPNVPKLLSTDKFDFFKVTDWLLENKKEEINTILKPAILEKTFKIAHQSML